MATATTPDEKNRDVRPKTYCFRALTAAADKPESASEDIDPEERLKL
jgi:hypothetical protein